MNTTIDVLPGQAASAIAPRVSNLTARDYDGWVKWGIASPTSDAGVAVTPTTATQHSPIWQGINIIAGDTGQLAFELMRRQGDRLTRDNSHAIDWLITNDPNEFQTIDVWLEMMQAWAIGWGNAISVIERDRRLRAVRLVPLMPDRTHYEKLGPGQYIILSRLDESAEYTAFLPEQTIHVRGLTSDGFWGLSAVKQCRNRIGHGMALLKHGNANFKNGSRPSGVLKHSGTLGVEARQNLREEWNQLHRGPDNAGNTAVLWEGMEWQQLAMSNEDSQWLESMELDIMFAAGVLNLPPYKLGYMKDSAVRANLEAQQKEYFNSYLSRHANRIRNELVRKLLTLEERRNRGYTIKVDPGTLTQGTRKEKMETLAMGVTARLITRNEGREELGLNPVDGGDEFENPAIDTVESGSSSDSEGLENALRKRGVEPLLAAESRRVKDLATGKKDFKSTVAKFYEGFAEFGEPFVGPLASLVGSGGERVLTELAAFAQQRNSAMQRLAEATHEKDLLGAVAAYLESARDNAIDQLTKRLSDAK